MIVLLVPEGYGGAYGAGHWKDLASLRSVLEECGYAYETAFPPAGEFDSLVERCAEGEITDLVVYYSFWPALLRRVREKAPWVRLHVRTVNAEALQHWHRAEVELRPSRKTLRSVYGAVRLASRDARCRQLADSLLGISEWDDRRYWSRLPGGARVSSLPYHSPWPRLRPAVRPRPWNERENAILCLAGGRDPIGRSMVAGFEKLAATADADGSASRWRFLLSGGVDGTGHRTDAAPGVEPIQGALEPWDGLCEARAVAVLTPLGFGMKTTVVDALAAGAHVLVDPVLARRLPDAVRAHCIVCDPASHSGVTAVLRRLDEAPRVGGINEEWRGLAAASLRVALTPPKPHLTRSPVPPPARARVA